MNRKKKMKMKKYKMKNPKLFKIRLLMKILLNLKQTVQKKTVYIL